MSNADKIYFEALEALKKITGPRPSLFSDNKQRIAAARADILDAIKNHGIDLILQAMMEDIQNDINLRKKSGVEHRIAEKKLEFLSKALYCSVRNADKQILDAEPLGELDE